MRFIETIEIKNFKSIRHQRIEGCKRINVFIGYPNVGKEWRNEKNLRFKANNNVERITNYLPSKKIIVKKYQFHHSFNQNKMTGYDLLSPNGENLFDVIELNSDIRKEVLDLFNVYGLKLAFDKNTNTLKIIKALKDGTLFLIPFHQIADTLQRLIFYKAAIYSNTQSVLWVLKICKLGNINLEEFGLSADLDEFKNYTKRRSSLEDEKLKKLFKEITGNNNINEVSKLKSWIKILIDKNYQVDINELRNA